MRVLEAKEVAEMLGVTPYTVTKMMNEKKIRNAYQKNRKWFVKLEDVNNYLKEKKQHEEMMKNYYSSKETAGVLKRDKETINRWLREGMFPDAIKGENREWFIPKVDVDKLLSLETVDSNIIETKEKKVGKTYGSMTILDVTGYKREGRQNKIFVEVGCECGIRKEMPLYWLTDGRVKYCSNECFAKSGVTLGEKFGFLTVIDDAGLRHYGGDPRKRRFVRVICDCGNEKEFLFKKVREGVQTSCGRGCPMWRQNLIGKKYGFLTVIKEIEKSKKDRKFICKCDCGKKAEKEMYKLTAGHTKFCGHTCELQKGENHHNWDAYKTMEERLQGREYYEYNQWRKKVYIRDKFCCVKCGHKKDLNAHHMDSYDWCKEKRTDVNNGAVLCDTCHISFHKEYGFGKNTREQFEEWMGKTVEEMLAIK